MEIVTTANKKKQQDTINIRDIIYMCLSKWYWFVLSLAICIGAAVWYLLTTPPTYTRTASILIKDSKTGTSTSEVSEAFSDMSIFNTSVNITNEVEALQTPDIVREVVSRLNLDVDYSTPGRFHSETLYGTTLPIIVDFTNMPQKSSASFTVDIGKDGHITLYDFDGAIDGVSVKGNIGDTISTPVGAVIVNKGKGYGQTNVSTVNVKKIPLSAATASYNSRLSVTQKNEKSSIINLTISDASIEQADDFLNGLIAVYNENWVKDKNQIAVSTSMFINDRLGVIESELGNVDNDISTFKSENLLPDVGAAASIAMAQASEANSAIKDLNNQVYMARYIRNYLSNTANDNDLIPINSGVDNLNISSQITEYNNQLMERNSLITHTSEKNPMIQEMDKNLAALRGALVTSIDNQIVALNAQIKTMQGFGGMATTQIASNPKQAKYLLSVERQQKVKESLYLYLLQKREENELSQAFTAYNTSVLMAPTGSNKPTAPKRMHILLIAFVIGLAIPSLIIFLKETMNTVVRGRRDIDSLTIPFIGEIPQHGKLNIKAKNKTRDIVVREKTRDSINEAFRVVRTNIEFMAGKHTEGEVIAITSSNPSSGKTFISYNLALSLAIKGKRVICIDLDLRRGTLSKYIDSPKEGVSNYLAEQTDAIEQLIVHTPTDDELKHSFDIIPIGFRPPNPTELLFTDRLVTLLKVLRQCYDFIILDCPPVEIVADAAIINQVVDETIFVVRAGLFDKAMLPDVQKFYDEKKYRNMSILLNGTSGGSGKYGYRYSYRYGYKYGYQN